MTTLSPTHPEAVRHLDRLATRLRVVGPRLAAREGAQAQEQLQAIRAGLQNLADITAEADGEPRRPVPELSGYALADQALVLGHDLLGHDRLGHDRLAGDSDGPERSDRFRLVAVEAIQRIYQLL